MPQDSSYLFSVIGEKHRLRILSVLLNSSLNVEEIRNKLNIEETLLSKHLKALREAGLVITSRDGRRIFYQVNPKIKKTKSNNSLVLDCCEIKLKNI